MSSLLLPCTVFSPDSLQSAASSKTVSWLGTSELWSQNSGEIEALEQDPYELAQAQLRRGSMDGSSVLHASENFKYNGC